MAETDQKPARRRGVIAWTFRVGLWLCGLAMVAGILFFVLGLLANRAGQIPPELRADPQDFVKLLTPEATSRTTAAASSDSTSHSAANENISMPEELTRTDWEYQRRQDGLFQRNTPLTPKEIEWLQKLAPVVKALHRLVQSRPQTEESFGRFVLAHRDAWSFLLVQDARYQAQQDRFATAHDDLIDMLELWQWKCPPAEDFIQMQFEYICELLLRCVEDPRWPGDQWAGIPERLEAIDEKLFDPAAFRMSLVRIHLQRRRGLVELLDRSWYKDPYFDPKIGPNDYLSKQLDIPNPTKLLAASVEAMTTKAGSAEELKKYDRDFTKVLELTQLSYPERFAKYGACAKKSETGDDKFLPGQYQYYLGDMFAMTETPVHLIRVGIMWRIDQQRTRALRSEYMLGKTHHPWRDPYSEKPCIMNETTTCTLIYSVGPYMNTTIDKIRYHGNPRIILPK